MNILYIEDDDSDFELSSRELHRSIPDVTITWANTVKEALGALHNGRPYDIVLTDLRLPDGSGLEIVHAIRQQNLPAAVVVLTGQGDEDIAVGAIKAGADDYVAKRSGYYDRLPDIVRTAYARFQAESTRRRGQLRVLYAQHDAGEVEQTRRHLAQHAPHIRLHTVAGGGGVLAELPASPTEETRHDVLLLDFNLRDVNALDLIKTIRDERRLDLPVVLVTSQGDQELAAQVLRLGVEAYIVKHAGYLFQLPMALENAHYRAWLAREQAALRASEERFRRLAENAPDLIYRYAFVPQPHFEYVSPSALRMTGYTPEDHYADPQLGLKLVHPDDRHLLEEANRAALAPDTPIFLRWVRKDGTIVWTEQRNRPIYDGEGRLVAFEGIARDVTQAHEMMQSLQQRLVELEALHNLSNALRTAQTQDEAVAILLEQTLAAFQTEAAAIWLLDSASGALRTVGTSGWCNAFHAAQLAPGEGITGAVFLTAKAHVEADILSNTRLAEPLKSATPPGWGAGWAPIRTSDEIVGVLFVALRRPQQITPEQTRLLISLAEMAGGIIQRLRLFQQTQSQAELTRQIVNTVPEGLALLDDGGRILLANPAAASLLSDLGGGAPGSALTTLGDHPLSEVLADTQSWQELEWRGRIFALNARPVEPDRPQTSWVLVVNEITKERENQRYQEVQDRLATVGQLAAGLAHDFNNVLGVISVYADILLMAPNLLPKQKQQLSTIVDQTHHAANLVRQVLDFSRRSVMERQRVDLYPLLNEQVKLLRHTLPENIELHLQMDHAPLLLDADPTRLRQVLMNLAINARDAMPEGGALTFDLTRLQIAGANGHTAPLPDIAPGDWLRLVVADTGTGIAAAHLPHIFEPFFTTKGPGMGAGLGLAQVYGIVKQHGGAITVASTLGEGTAFTIYLPLTAGEARLQAAAPTAKAVGGSEQILLVEDNADLREALAHSLGSLGYRVLPAHDADTALALAEAAADPIDLVLSDLVLPGRSGIEMFSALQPLHPAAKLVIMTGHPITQARMESLRAADSWIQKPFALESLTHRVRELLDER